MTEEALTGGLKSFKYSKGNENKLDEERRNAIAQGYEEYYLRRKREKRNRIILWIIAGLVALVGIVCLILR
ncbi:MAG: hypothetical protein QXD13_01410 [Candidatus Pacearchaeota archaeon]